jgi:hypothetical protein
MTDLGRVRKVVPSTCPAQVGTGVEISSASFSFEARLCTENGQPVTEIFGFFLALDDDDAESPLQTEVFVVPTGSPISSLGLSCIPGRLDAIAAELRQNVFHCPCLSTERCPALDEMRLLEAMEHAVGDGSVTGSPRTA